jgi:mannosyl-3-phosphoglycerate phosphatase
VEDVGLKVISGVRFMDVTGGNNKGTAVKVLIDLFKYKYKVVFFGIGDSPNDESISRFPYVFQRTDGTWQSLHVERIMRLKGVGPEGWKLAFNEIMNYFKR